jgi:hypothetical protein
MEAAMARFQLEMEGATAACLRLECRRKEVLKMKEDENKRESLGNEIAV